MDEDVQDSIGYALDLAQHGAKADFAEAMKGDLRDVVEIRTRNETGDSTFRAMYTAKIGSVIYVLHVFKKKSTSGISTPRPDLELIRRRLREARAHYEQTQSQR